MNRSPAARASSADTDLGDTRATITRDAAMTEAVELHRSGRFDAARALFEAVLKANPRDADAWHLLGVTTDAKGDPAAAVDLITRALAIREMASYRSNLGLTLAHLGRNVEAMVEYRRALDLQPDFPEAWNNLGVALAALRRPDEAEDAYRKAIEARPEYSEALGNLGNTLRGMGRTDEAVIVFRDALAHNSAMGRTPLAHALRAAGKIAEAEAIFRDEVSSHPDSPEALNNLAAALGQDGRSEEAMALLPRATELRPNYPEAFANLGHVLQQIGRLEEAVAACRRALELRPDYPEALTNLGNALRMLDQFDAAETAQRRVLALRPTDVGCFNNLAITLQAQHRVHEARALLDLAAALEPDEPETRHHRAMLLLRQGRLIEGWEDYEWRSRTKQAGDAYKQFEGQTAWRGEPLQAKTILLVPEQGLGDTLQFVRYAQLLVARGAKVILGAQKPLVRLLRSLGPGIEVVATGDALSHYDVMCPLLSLPRGFGTSLQTIPATVPYVHAEASAVRRWGARIGLDQPGLRVGLVWAGNPKHLGDRHRSIVFSTLIPLFGVPGLRWFSLQTGERAADTTDHDIEDLSAELADFAETAAAVACLDLVVTVDTSVAHLVGALGKPVWVLLPALADWRWMTNGDVSPWYPTMRLFRQDTQRSWAPVVATVVETLLNLVDAKT